MKRTTIHNTLFFSFLLQFTLVALTHAEQTTQNQASSPETHITQRIKLEKQRVEVQEQIKNLEEQRAHLQETLASDPKPESEETLAQVEKKILQLKHDDAQLKNHLKTLTHSPIEPSETPAKPQVPQKEPLTQAEKQQRIQHFKTELSKLQKNLYQIQEQIQIMKQRHDARPSPALQNQIQLFEKNLANQKRQEKKLLAQLAELTE